MKKLRHGVLRLMLAALLVAVSAPALLLVPAAADAVEKAWVQQTGIFGDDVGVKLHSIVYVEDTIYIAGIAGVADGPSMAKSTDNGDSWTLINPPNVAEGTNEEIENMFWLDANTGYVVGQAGYMAKTTNGGESWTDMTGLGDKSEDRAVRGIHFLDDDTGWVCGGDKAGSFYIYYTDDGGTSWTEQTLTGESTANGGVLLDIVFTSETEGWVGGKNGRIFHTTNGGSTWTKLDTTTVGVYDDDSYAMIQQIIAVDADNLWACGSKNETPGPGILKSVNGGSAWTQTYDDKIDYTDEFKGMDALDANTVYVVGDESIIVRTDNGGTDWYEYTIDGLEGMHASIQDIEVVDADTGWAVTLGGSVLQLQDPVAPVAGFGTLVVGGGEVAAASVGDDIIFTNNTLNQPTSIEWDFGNDDTLTWTKNDAETANNYSPTYSYDTAGTYTVTLSAVNAYGTDEIQKTVLIVAEGVSPIDVTPEDSTGGTYPDSNASPRLFVPAGGLAKKTALTIAELTELPADAPAGYTAGDTIFSLTLVDEDGAAVTTCVDNTETEAVEQFSIVVEYSTEDLAAASDDVSKLRLAYYDTATSEWVVKETNNVGTLLQASSDHLSTWAVMVYEGEGGGCCAGAAATAADIASSIGLLGMLGMAATYLHLRKKKS